MPAMEKAARLWDRTALTNVLVDIAIPTEITNEKQRDLIALHIGHDFLSGWTANDGRAVQ